jgi:polyhydroxyalkanoate synthesis regulator phasin
MLMVLMIVPFAITAAASSPARAKDPELGAGVTKEFPASLEDMMQALREVLGDNIIHGTLIYDKQPVLDGAKSVDSTLVFGAYSGSGKVFYKVRPDAIAPRHFLDSADQGTIAVRYILTAITPERMRLHIDALYVEKNHRVVHISDGTVEASEAKAIEDHLTAIQFTEQETAEANRRRESAELVKETQLRQHIEETKLLEQTQGSVQDLERQIVALRREMERRVKAPGAQMKAAPFLSSASLVTVPAYTELLVVIVTPHWYGVETPDGHRGWLPVEQLEPLP